MKPFAFLECRLPCAIAEDEYQVLQRITGLGQSGLERIWLDSLAGEIDYSRYSGLIVSGSPFGYHTEQSAKSPAQIKIEANIDSVVDYCLAADYPYFGICYGLQAVAIHQRMPLTSEYPEEIDAVQLMLTDQGKDDPIFSQLPAEFYCVTGHNDALAEPLITGVHLVRSATCPIQAVRFGKNVYGIQFHPEINHESLEIRLATYAGKYFQIDAADRVRASVAKRDISPSEVLVRNFVRRYQKG